MASTFRSASGFRTGRWAGICSGRRCPTSSRCSPPRCAAPGFRLPPTGTPAGLDTSRMTGRRGLGRIFQSCVPIRRRIPARSGSVDSCTGIHRRRHRRGRRSTSICPGRWALQFLTGHSGQTRATGECRTRPRTQVVLALTQIRRVPPPFPGAKMPPKTAMLSIPGGTLLNRLVRKCGRHCWALDLACLRGLRESASVSSLRSQPTRRGLRRVLGTVLSAYRARSVGPARERMLGTWSAGCRSAGNIYEFSYEE